MQQSNNKRIAKNTMFLYIRMGISMLVGLYTSRIVLEALGVDDYGIYNVVGSFIVAFTFISGPLKSATQRFLNFELGKGIKGKLNEVINISFYIYIFLSVILVIVIEIAGMWFLNHKMQMPVNRYNAAHFAFQMSVLTLILHLIRTPFESLIIAYENMSFYAYISIAEVVLKLMNAFLLLLIPFDKLKIFSVNMLVISIVIFFITFYYCRKKFIDAKVQFPYKKWNWPLFKELMGFSGWSLFGSVASVSANQGINLLLNLFYGVAVNAAMGIASQVNTSIVQFVTNFQVAFRPQLVKYYAQNKMDDLRTLVINTSKYSYLLLFMLVCPVAFNMPFLLKVWLKNPPEYASEFSIMMLIYALLESLSAPMWMTIQATGRIKKYQIVISCVMFLNVALSYFFLKIGFGPVTVLVIKCCLDLVYFIVRIVFVKFKIQLSLKHYFIKTLLPIVSVTAISLSCLYFIDSKCENDLFKLIITSTAFLFISSISIFFFGINKAEKNQIVVFLKKRFSL